MLQKSYEKTTMLGHRLDNVFLQIHVGFFFLDNDVITRNLEKATPWVRVVAMGNFSIVKPRAFKGIPGHCEATK